MALRKSICLLGFCLVICPFLTFVKPQDYFKTPTKKDGWISPDVAFVPSHPLKSARHDVPDEDIAECHKNLNEWVAKYSECERALQTLEFGGSEENVKTNEIEIAVSKPSGECLQEKNGATAYLQRFIHLLLEVSNLNNVEVQPQNSAKFTISISSEHLHTLRKFVSDGDVKSIPLRKLDEILGSVLVKPFFALPEFNLGDIVNKLPSFHIGSFFISVFLPTVWFLSILLLTKNIKKSFVWLTPVAFLTSFITTAYQMFEEAQIKQYEEMKKYSDRPQDCNGKFSIMELVLGKNGDCLKFLKAHHMDPNLGITSFKVLTQMFGETMAATMGHFGSGTFILLDNFQGIGLLNRIWLSALACVLLFAMIVLLLLVITGGTGKLPFFMGSFSFDNSPQRQPHLSGHSEARATVAPQNTEALPSTGNITVNITGQVPPNMHELLESLSRGASASNQHNLVSPNTAISRDVLASGDNAHSDLLNQSHLNRPHGNFLSKKTHKQFSQLSSKYKSKNKSSNKLIIKRARNLSL